MSVLIWDGNLPFAAREECVRSKLDLFEHLFATEHLETSIEMWWDSLCLDWRSGNRNRKRGDEDAHSVARVTQIVRCVRLMRAV